MYVVTFNDFVLLGPITWNTSMFNSVIEEDTGFKVNILPSDKQNVPLDLGNGIKVRHALENKPNINSKIQKYDGPFWTFTESTGTHSYTAVDKPLEIVKGELKQILAHVRWTKEISGFDMSIQGHSVKIDTSRGSRDSYLQQYLILGDGENVNWKFSGAWINLTKAELKQIVDNINAHVANSFNWEASISLVIDNALTLQALDQVIIIEKQEEE